MNHLQVAAVVVVYKEMLKTEIILAPCAFDEVVIFAFATAFDGKREIN